METNQKSAEVIDLKYSLDNMPSVMVSDASRNPRFNGTPLLACVCELTPAELVKNLDYAMHMMVRLWNKENELMDCDWEAYWKLREIRNAIAKGGNIIEFE